jgi:anthranilate phosphoribosyltransferase
LPNAVLTRALDAVASGRDLAREEASEVLAEIMAGQASESQIAGLLVALRTKGETEEELAGLAATMRALATPVPCARDDLVDTAGTGGGRPTFNVSTTAALIAAGAGCALAKHGNRSATGPSGSADVLEALGARIDLEPAAVARCIDAAGFGFLFAPAHHTAMRWVMPVRRELAVRTVFNFLGPLTNPAGASRQLLGVSHRHYQETIAEALVSLGCERALVVAGEDGVDELTIAGPTRVIEVCDSGTEEWYAEPEEVGVEPAPLETIAGGDPSENAEIVRGVLDGIAGPPLEVVVLNAGAAILVSGGADDDLAAAVERAREAISSGAARLVLDRLVELSGRLAEDGR